MSAAFPFAALRPALLAMAGVGLGAGLGATLLGRPAAAGAIWMAGTAPVLLALLAEIFGSLRRGEVGLDIVAALSMAGALAFGEALAGIVVALMYAGGQYLEAYAEGRARREMNALLARVPRTALRYGDAGLETVPVDELRPGDRILIRRGEVVPTDGTVETGLALVDASTLTGEALPVRARPGEPVPSGSTNVGNAFDLRSTHTAAESTYAGIVRLVEAAQASKAPMSRLADRFAIAFLVVTVALAGGAWIWTADPIRALSVLVVATPCPLILAVPVAIISGVSRCARIGVLVKGGRPLEALAHVRTVVFDKTGTLTHGTARLIGSEGAPGWTEEELLRVAASLDQASTHVTAQALVAEARRRGLSLSLPEKVTETAGEGVEGIVGGRQVAVGGRRFVAGALRQAAPPARSGSLPPGSAVVHVAVDGVHAGALHLADTLREGTAEFLHALRRLGIERIVLASGDSRDVVAALASRLPIDDVAAELAPEDKIAVVAKEGARGPVMMVGDGVNDAPALAASGLGVAMGAKGAAASAEAADVVLLVDRLDRLLPAIGIARRARFIALQSVYVGLGLSAVGMIAAALGHLTPVQGALIQEVIDVAVILNALRALSEARPIWRRWESPAASAIAVR